LSKSESEGNSTCDRLTSPEVGEWEATSTLKDVVVNHLASSQLQSPSNPPSAMSDFPFGIHSSPDFPRLTDHCLTDSMTVEISMLSSPSQNVVESADDTDTHSVLSTPPLQPDDSDNDTTLLPPPETDHCADGTLFSSDDKMNNLFSPQSPNSEQSQLNSLFDGDSTAKVVNNYSGDDSDDAISKQLDLDVDTPLHLGNGIAPKTNDNKQQICDGPASPGFDETERQFSCDLTILADAILNSLNENDKLKDEPTLDSLNCDDDAALTRESSQECLAVQSSESLNDTLDLTLHIALEAALASELESGPLIIDEGAANSSNGLCSAGDVATKTESVGHIKSCDVGGITSAPESSLHLLVTHVRGNVADSDVKMEVGCSASSTKEAASDECKLFASTSTISALTTGISNLISSPLVWNDDQLSLLDSFQSKVKGASVMPCVASFSSSSSSESDDVWIPDWKLQTNAVVKVRRMDSATLAKYTIGTENKGVKLQSSSFSKLSLSGQLTSSKMRDDAKPKKISEILTPRFVDSDSDSLDDELLNSRVLTKKLLPTKAAPERPASSVVELGKDKNQLPSAALVTSSTPSLEADQFSSAATSILIQQKLSNYADCYNSPQFQPVVRLIRLPLEFFRMLQQSPRPSASSSSSISVSDFAKRFVKLKISAAHALHLILPSS